MIEDTLNDFLARQIHLHVSEGQLKIQAPKGALSASDKAFLTKHKSEIIEALLAQNSQEIPATDTQRRLWFLQELNPGNTAYLVRGAFRIAGPLNPEQFRHALLQVLNRHSILRTHFEYRDGQLFQLILPPGFLPFSQSRIQKTELESEMNHFFSQPLPLSQNPPLCFHLFEISTEEWVFVSAIHHVLTDGWSTAVFVQDLMTFYAGEVLTPLESEFTQEIEAYHTPEADSNWLEQLRSGPLFMDLPFDTLTPENKLPCRLHLPYDGQALTDFCQRHQLTQFVVLLGVWHWLLAQVSGQDASLCAYPVANRRTQVSEHLIGPFVNTALSTLNCTLEDPLTLLYTFKQQIYEHPEREHIPFESLVQSLGISRQGGVFPQVMFVLQNFPLTWPKLQGLEVSALSLPPRDPLAEVCLTVNPFEHRIELETSARFTHQQSQRLLETYLRLLQALCQDASQWPPLFKEPMFQLEHSFEPLDLPEVIAGFAQSQPEALALKSKDHTMTYEALDQSANQWRQILEGAHSVAILCLSTTEAIVAMLAALISRVTYIPLDPHGPLERNLMILENAQPDLLICDLDSPPKGPWQILDPKDRPQSRVLHPDPAPTAPQTAYMIYTSGSTGQPKGVPISFAQLGRLVPSVRARYDTRRHHNWALFHSVAFDYAIWEIWGALSQGATLHLFEPEQKLDIERFWGYCLQHKIDLLHLTPSALTLLKPVATQQPAPFSLTLILSGEKLNLSLLKPWFASYGQQLRVFNSYGITETTVFVTFREIHAKETDHPSLIGPPLPDLNLHLLNPELKRVLPGMPGEIYVSGHGVGKGYFQNHKLSQARFLTSSQGETLYRTGDMAKELEGELVYLQRNDRQVQIRGFRVEPSEIEAALLTLDEVQAAYVQVLHDQIVAYLVGTQRTRFQLNLDLKPLLLPAMLPQKYIFLSALPLTQNGKVDTTALPLPEVISAEEADTDDMHMAPIPGIEATLAQMMADLLSLKQIDRHTPFFDLGGHSLMMVQAQEQIKSQWGIHVPLISFFEYPTLAKLSAHIGDLQSGEDDSPAFNHISPPGPTKQPIKNQIKDIAIIGMAGQFPNSPDLQVFWQNLLSGVDCITELSEEVLVQSGVSPGVFQQDNYLPYTGVLPHQDLFDHTFFKYSPSEARILDPQQRLALTQAWKTLEHAGYGDISQAQSVAVFASAGISRYLLTHLMTQDLPLASPMELLVANDKDYIASRVAYKLNLTGPALAVQSACSSSLAAIHLACESLMRGEAQMALAGGVSLDPDPQGYVPVEGGIYSHDGTCRPFDAQASGIIGGSGVGWVLLKPYEDALKDGDTVYARIIGSAMNNDGQDKVGFMAPSLKGQIKVMQQALQEARIAPDNLTYIEAHGTGTPMGDPIEVAAIQKVYGATHAQMSAPACAMGSVKANIGHLDAAAGIAGALKMILSIHHGQYTPQRHFETPHPQLFLKGTRFEILTHNKPWTGQRYGAVSSLGIGGTNVHLVMTSADPNSAFEPSQTPQLLLVSHHDKPMLSEAQKQLTKALKGFSLADIAYTLQRGRPRLKHASCAIAEPGNPTLKYHVLSVPQQHLVWAFAGLRTRSIQQGLALAKAYPAFAQILEGVLGHFKQWGLDLSSDMPQKCVQSALHMQPLSFAFDYSLGRFLKQLGVQPQLLVGHSFGEFAAATLAGVWSLEDACRLVYHRGRLFDALPGGEAHVVMCAVDDLPELPQGVVLAGVNHEQSVTLSGPRGSLDALISELHHQGISTRDLQLMHPVHHPLLEDIAQAFAEELQKVQFFPPQIPMLSCLTGQTFAPDAAYFVKQLTQTVRFDKVLHQVPAQALVHCLSGGRGLQGVIQAQNLPAHSLLPGQEPLPGFLKGLAQLWNMDIPLKWEVLHATPCRVPLPPLPLKEESHWVPRGTGGVHLQPDLQGLYVPLWKQVPFSRFSDQTPLSFEQETDWYYWDSPPPTLQHTQPLSSLQNKTAKAVHNLCVWIPPELSQDSYTEAFEQLVLALQAALDPASQIHLKLWTPPFSVISRQETLEPAAALFLGLVQCLPYEYPQLTCQLIETDRFPETLAPSKESHLAYRFNQYWQSDWQPVSESLPKSAWPQGDILILGSGGIASALIRALLNETRRIFVFARSPLASDLEQQVTRIPVDLSRTDSLENALDELSTHTQDLSWVVHAAGVAGQDILLNLTPEKLHAHLNIKVQNTHHLFNAFKLRGIAFEQALLCSAMSRFLGGPGQTLYVAANAYLDAFAQTDPRIKVINWGTWKEAGMAFKHNQSGTLGAFHKDILKWGITNAQGVDMVQKTFAQPQTQWVHSPLPKEALYKQAALLMKTPARRKKSVIQNAHRPPKNDIEAKICALWAQALGYDSVDPEGDFYDLGGHSLAMIQLKTELEATLGQPIALDQLLQYTTPADLAEALIQKPVTLEETPKSCLVKLNMHTEKTPLVCIHAVSGAVFPFQALAARVQRPFYGIQSQGLLGRAPHTDWTELGKAYAHLIQKNCPQPYVLGGWSFGALAAIEAAHWLQLWGHAPEALFLLDMALPDSQRTAQETEIRERFELDMKRLFGDATPESSQQELKETLWDVFEAHIQMSPQFKPRVLDLPVTLLAASAGFGQEDPRPDLGWGEWFPQLTRLDLQGDHYSILTPESVSQWADLLP